MIRGVAISNIAWPAAADQKVLAVLRGFGFSGIEIAPGKSVEGWPSKPAQLAELRTRFEGEGLPIVALQAILFGVQGAELFVSRQTQRRLFDHLSIVAQVAGALGAGACVFGAPKARDPSGLPPQEAFDRAVEFFSSIGPAFEAEGTCLTFEANASAYGCRFITHTREALELVRQINHPGIRLQIDTGTMFLNGENPLVIADAIGWASHFHVSEPNLAPLGTIGSDHVAIAAALVSVRYDRWLSVEMRETKDWHKSIEGAGTLMKTAYQRVLCDPLL